MSRWWPFRRSGLTCLQIVELVTEYLEGSLPGRVRTRFEAHIAACPACTAYLAQMRDTLKVLGSFSNDAIAPELEAELLSAFRTWNQSERPRGGT